MPPFVLIVEDETQTGENLAAFIGEELGWEVLHFEKGGDALAYCQKEGLPNILIMDIELNKESGENSNGISVAQKIQALAAAQKQALHLVYLTSKYHNEIYYNSAKQLTGITVEFLPKPVQLSLLQTLLEKFAANLPLPLTTWNIRLLPVGQDFKIEFKVYLKRGEIKSVLVQHFLVARTIKNNGGKTIERIALFVEENNNLKEYQVACYLKELKEEAKNNNLFFQGESFVANRTHIKGIDEQIMSIAGYADKIYLSDADYRNYKK